MLTISCSACAKKLAVGENAIGKKVQCPNCKQIMRVPAPVAAGATTAFEKPAPHIGAGIQAPTLAQSAADGSEAPTEFDNRLAARKTLGVSPAHVSRPRGRRWRSAVQRHMDSLPQPATDR